MFMFPFKVVNGNECLLITNRDELEKFITFAQVYLSLPIMTVVTEIQPAEDRRVRSMEAAEQVTPIAPPATSPSPGEMKAYSANDGWLKKAWEAANQPAQGATNRELYEAARGLGYKSNAQDSVAAFKTAIRISPHMERVGLRDNVVLWKWTETPHETRRTNPPKTQPAHNVPLAYHGPRDPNLRNPQEGERAIDYAVRALKETGYPLRTAQLAEVMYDLGWKTSGDALETLASTLRKSRYGHIVTNQKGFWVLAGEQVTNGGHEKQETLTEDSDSQLDMTVEDLLLMKQT